MTMIVDMISNDPILQRKTLFRGKTDLLSKTFVIPIDFDANIIQVTEEFVGRPDLLSKEVYGSEEYASILCKLNGISNPLSLNKGMYIVVPKPDALDDFYVIPELSWEDKEDTSEDYNKNKVIGKTDRFTPKSKSVKDKKRKPNEALITDKRFNIDRLSKSVVY